MIKVIVLKTGKQCEVSLMDIQRDDIRKTGLYEVLDYAQYSLELQQALSAQKISKLFVSASERSQ